LDAAGLLDRDRQGIRADRDTVDVRMRVALQALRLWDHGSMRTVTLDVRPLENALADLARTWKTGKREAAARISFATPGLLGEVPTTSNLHAASKFHTRLSGIAATEPSHVRN